MMDILQKLADASTPDEVQACLDEAGIELPSGEPSGPPEVEVSAEPETEDAPPQDYKSLRSSALKKAMGEEA